MLGWFSRHALAVNLSVVVIGGSGTRMVKVISLPPSSAERMALRS